MVEEELPMKGVGTGGTEEDGQAIGDGLPTEVLGAMPETSITSETPIRT